MILGARLWGRSYIGRCTRTHHLAILTSGKGIYCWWHRLRHVRNPPPEQV